MNYNSHFCKGENIWKQICQECKEVKKIGELLITHESFLELDKRKILKQKIWQLVLCPRLTLLTEKLEAGKQ